MKRSVVCISALLVATGILPGTAIATVVEGPFTFTNDTGIKASDLHVVFAGTGGSLSGPVNVTAQPPGAPAAIANASSNNAVIDWKTPAIANGEAVSFTLNSDFAGITPASVRWTEFGNTVSGTGPIWPVARKPSVTGNFGTLEVPDMHSALDIDAPIDTPVRAVVTSTLVGIFGNGVYLSDGTNLYAYAHVKEVSGATGIGYTAADIGRVFNRGDPIGFVLGSTNPSGGTFDHLHFEYIPDLGTDASIKKPDGSYKTGGEIITLADPARINPLLALYDVKDPDASDGNNAPEIGPIFWRPVADAVAGFAEFGNQESKPTVRKGTFINGAVDLIEQITDNQGGIQPPGGHRRKDIVDTTVMIDDVIVSDPFQVSYKVQGTGVVADKTIAERTLVTFNKTHATHDAQKSIVFDHPLRDVDIPGTGAVPVTYNHSFVLTNTDGAKPTAANAWVTRAKVGTGGADGTGGAMAANNAEGKFPDGIYEVDGYGFDIGADGKPANKTSVTYEARVNNWKQTAVPTKGDGASNIRRADDRFLKDGPEQSMSELLRSYTARVDLGISDDIYLVGDNYLDGRVYDWYLFDYKGLWTEGDPFTAPLLRGKTNPADATGFIDDTLLTDALTLSGLGSGSYFDLIIDYDFDGKFSWTLDGLGALRVALVPEPTTLLLFTPLLALCLWLSAPIRSRTDAVAST